MHFGALPFGFYKGGRSGPVTEARTRAEWRLVRGVNFRGNALFCAGSLCGHPCLPGWLSLRGTLSASELRTPGGNRSHVLSELATAVGVGRGAIAEDEPRRGGVPTVEEPGRRRQGYRRFLPGKIQRASLTSCAAARR
jgi:hypothetical protein